MGLRDLVQGLVSTVAFPAVGDIVETVEYVRKDSRPRYDTKTGTKYPSTGDASIQVRAVFQPRSGNKGAAFEDISRREVPGELEALIPALDFTDFAPATNDRLIRNQESYVVRGAETDPAGATWTLTIQREGGSTRP